MSRTGILQCWSFQTIPESQVTCDGSDIPFVLRRKIAWDRGHWLSGIAYAWRVRGHRFNSSTKKVGRNTVYPKEIAKDVTISLWKKRNILQCSLLETPSVNRSGVPVPFVHTRIVLIGPRYLQHWSCVSSLPDPPPSWPVTPWSINVCFIHFCAFKRHCWATRGISSLGVSAEPCP